MNPFDAIPVPTFREVVAGHVAARPDATMLRFGERSWTWRAFAAQAERIAARLVADGFAPGDRIAHLGRNSDANPLLAYAAARAGLIFVPINWRLSPREIASIVEDSGSRLLFLGAGFAAPAGSASLSETILLDDAWLATARDFPLQEGGPRDTVVLLYTSGTTGVPKGVMLSHRSLFGTSMMRARHRVAWDDWGPDDVTLAPIPLGHAGGFGTMTRAMFFGSQTVIQPAFDPGAVLDAIEHQGISKLGLVPTAIRMVLDHPRARQVDYSRIKTMFYGAAPITLDLLREAIAVFGCRFAQSYGMSETYATCVVLPPEDHDVAGNPRMRSAGRALPGTELRIVGENGAVLAPGETGEIAIRCISTMTGYWNRPDDTAAVLDKDGWYRTGDAGFLDADFYVHVRDRVKDMIISGGENVYPVEVENVLADHPDVAQVAVIGVPDPLWGEAVTAAIVAAPGRRIDPDALIDWAKTRLAHFKVPKTIALVDALPLNAAGKVQKAALRDRFRTDSEQAALASSMAGK
jgi:acyl-CoA synthetase (AMP-forming)/AMP-acid ligase II